VKYIHNEIYKTLKKETEENSRKWKDLPCSCIDIINIVRITVLLEVIYKSNAMLTKIQMTFFTYTEKVILKFIGKHKRH
jgi:hypothetical protein